MTDKMEIRNLAGNIQDAIIHFVRVVNNYDYPCMSRDIEVDGCMLVFNDKEAYQKFVDVFDILGMDFTTEEHDEHEEWRIDFEFSGGISE